MNIQQHIDAILNTPLSGEIDYILRPESKPIVATFGVFTIVGGETFQTLEGDIDLARPRVQISIYAVDNSALVTVVAAVKAAMLAANVLTETESPDTNELALYNTTASVPVDGYEPETGMYYSHLDYYCWV